MFTVVPELFSPTWGSQGRRQKNFHNSVKTGLKTIFLRSWSWP